MRNYHRLANTTRISYPSRLPYDHVDYPRGGYIQHRGISRRKRTGKMAERSKAADC